MVRRQVFRSELAERTDIACLAVELRRIDARHDAAVARVNGVDEHEVGRVEQRILVVDDPVRRCRRRSLIAHLHPAWSKRPEVEKDRGRSGTAVVAETKSGV